MLRGSVVTRIEHRFAHRRPNALAGDAQQPVAGIVAQADLARQDAVASDREVGRIVEAISEPNPND